MKKLGFLILMVSLMFCSCNNNNDPDLEIELPIYAVFMPATIELNKADISEQERAEIMKLVNNTHVVNDISEIPNDPFVKNDVFDCVNFNEQTLLIIYHFKSWTIETYSNRFFRNTQENSYNWVVRIGTGPVNDEPTETVQLTRFAILVRKLPPDADVKTWYSLTQL